MHVALIFRLLILKPGLYTLGWFYVCSGVVSIMLRKLLRYANVYSASYSSIKDCTYVAVGYKEMSSIFADQ